MQIGDKKAGPLWGDGSWNDGAGAARVYTLAGIIRYSMPYLNPGSLTDEEAQQVAAFITSKPRPRYPFKSRDYARLEDSGRRRLLPAGSRLTAIDAPRRRRPLVVGVRWRRAPTRSSSSGAAAGASAAACSAIANPNYDGAFMFCRIMFRNASERRRRRLVGRLAARRREPVVPPLRADPHQRQPRRRPANGTTSSIPLTDTERLSHCPFIMMTEPGGTYFDEAEAAGCATYLQKGGFLWADDFWGDYAFEHWMNELRKALPSGEYPLTDVPLDHPLFHVLYDVQGDPADPVDQLLVRHRRRAPRSAARDSADAARARHLRPRRPHPRRDDPQHRLRRRVRARRRQPRILRALRRRRLRLRRQHAALLDDALRGSGVLVLPHDAKPGRRRRRGGRADDLKDADRLSS